MTADDYFDFMDARKAASEQEHRASLLSRKLRRLIAAVEEVMGDLALGSARPVRDRQIARDKLRAAIAKAKP
jgi:hypothetical protein